MGGEFDVWSVEGAWSMRGEFGVWREWGELGVSVVWGDGDGGGRLDSVVGMLEAPAFALRRAFKDLVSSTRLEESITDAASDKPKNKGQNQYQVKHEASDTLGYAQKFGVRT